jgi:predicted unusual protein kinase regulating ubiquinone biosynthesis (AarF/ABC1/UbiB family)
LNKIIIIIIDCSCDINFEIISIFIDSEPKFVSVMVAMAVVEGLGKRLDPDVDVLMRAAPYVLKAALFS